jgi:hypothetical protein
MLGVDLVDHGESVVPAQERAFEVGVMDGEGLLPPGPFGADAVAPAHLAPGAVVLRLDRHRILGIEAVEVLVLPALAHPGDQGLGDLLDVHRSSSRLRLVSLADPGEIRLASATA